MNSEPVLLSAILTAAAAAVTPWLAKHGIDSDASQRIFSLVGAVATGLVAVLAALHARSKVTPIGKTITATGKLAPAFGNFGTQLGTPFATGGILSKPTAGVPADPTPTTAEAVTANLPEGAAPGAAPSTFVGNVDFTGVPIAQGPQGTVPIEAVTATNVPPASVEVPPESAPPT